jgi:phosphoribosylanthranilate isomerase
MKTKVCCISDAAEARMAAQEGADWLGLVGPMPSGPGVLSLEQAREIATSCHFSARPILLTSAQRADDILAEAAFVGVDAVQIVRHISCDEATQLKASALHYVQVIHVGGPEALALIGAYAPYCDAFLLDSGSPSREAFGGTGQTHDWSVSAEFVRRADKPVFLAGGLNPDNAREAICEVRPYGVDICSGVRRHHKLDPELLCAFMEKVGKARP